MIVAAYLYWPVTYLLVYRPFILPRLSSWDHVPLTIDNDDVDDRMVLHRRGHGIRSRRGGE